MLHSSMSSKAQWNSLIKRLPPGFRPISIDLHGYGKRAIPPPDAAFSLADEIELVNSVIDQHVPKGSPFHLIGHSYGGAVALRMAHEQSRRVLSMALFEPLSFGLLGWQEMAQHEVSELVMGIDRCIATDPVGATSMFIDYWNGRNAFSRISCARVKADLVAKIGKLRLDYQALLGDSLRPHHLPVLTMPVYLISGQYSPTPARRVAEVLARNLPNVTFQQVGGGHMAPLTHVEEVNQILLDFLRTEAAMSALT